ncbi:MAG: phosphoenolpyruvate--protein phosphotransferase [Parasulfuritortus sp.]|nr:phosphoenolpyruvate--protein phosphotransferase [Parasulfuritortus sp.]
MTFSLHGIGISGGYAIGRAQLYSHDRLEVPHYVLRKADIASEVARFDAAVAEARAECEQLRDHIPEGAPSELAAFLDLHALILADAMLSQVPKDLIRSTSCNAEWALAQQTEALLAQFDSIEDVYLRERRQDVKQVADKVLKALLGHPGHVPMKVSDEPTVLVAHDLSPSDMVIFKRHTYAGFITDLGGTTSHTAILARSLNISSVMALHNARALIQEGDVLIVDGIAGVVIVNPDELILEEYQLRQNQWRLEQQKLKRLKSSPSATLDGDGVELLGNIDLPQDVFEAQEENAAGIGLFRSEFLFMNRPDLPSEDEQFEAYRHVAAAMKGKPVVIRTLDVGADKSLAWLPDVSVNPALGLRAIRLCLAEPRIFIAQIRAILRASQYGQVRILIPMLASLGELDQALELIAQAKAELEREGQPFNPGIPIGGMIEIPAAALAAEWFARKLDFLSIGTNDLIQYTLAIDRTDDAVAHLYDPLHPAVLHLVAHTLKVGHRLKRPVSVCGEMAGDPKLTRLLLGMGLRSFSMHPAHLMAVKQQVMHSHVSSLTPLVAKLLRAGRPERIQAYLERINAL